MDPNLHLQLKLLDAELKKSQQTPYTGRRMECENLAGMHGRVGLNRGWAAPRLRVECKLEARPGYNSMSANEYSDEPSVLQAKVKVMAQLIRRSTQFCAYTGAGISTASGIDDYASKAKNSIAMKRKKVSGFQAQPTLAHRVMASIFRAGHLKHWVQQNHDGLPQKAGFPPEHLNEIHGAWYDPSNPVVPMSGSLRTDLCEWLYEWEEKTDLTLAMGTSLCGMNADRMVETPNTKARKRGSSCLGSIIVGLQQTVHDNDCSLRFFCTCDEVMALLARELGLAQPENEHCVRAQAEYKAVLPSSSIVQLVDRKIPGVLKIPYDSSGRLTSDEAKFTTWDLRAGAGVKITIGPGEGYVGTIAGRTPDGHVRVKLPCQREGSKDQGKKWVIYVLGQWWLETVVNGRCALLPFVNTTQKPKLPKLSKS